MVKYLGFGVEDVKRLAKVADIADNRRTILYNASFVADEIKELKAELEQVNERLKKFDWSTYKKDTDRRVEIRMAISEKQEVLDAVVEALDLAPDYFEHPQRDSAADKFEYECGALETDIPADFAEPFVARLYSIKSYEDILSVLKVAFVEAITEHPGIVLGSCDLTNFYNIVIYRNKNRLPEDVFDYNIDGNYRFEQIVRNFFSSHATVSRNYLSQYGIRVKSTMDSRNTYAFSYGV